jgi:hypothetical protein
MKITLGTLITSYSVLNLPAHSVYFLAGIFLILTLTFKVTSDFWNKNLQGRRQSEKINIEIESTQTL